MKLVLALALVVLGTVVSGKKRGPGLPHFERGKLNSAFKMLQTPDSAFEGAGDDCDKDAVKKCMRCTHGHAMICAIRTKMNPEITGAVAACEAEDATWADKDKAWQQTSGAWHRAVQACVAEDRPDRPPVSDSLMLLFRRKRSPGEGHGHGHGSGGMAAHMAAMGRGCNHPKYGHSKDDVKTCWRDMRKDHNACSRLIKKCGKLALCMGMGDAPTGDNDKAWYEYAKDLKETKKSAMLAHKRNVLLCHGAITADATDEQVETAMYGEAEE